MSGLRPLLLPQLVEVKKQRGLVESDVELPPSYSVHSASSSDVASVLPSPSTSVFSRTGYAPSSSSTSSLDLTSPWTESPASPTLPIYSSKTKPPLPDVQEEPYEREEDFIAAGLECDYGDFGLYDCLCDAPCSHHGDLVQSPTIPASYMASDVDYDLGFLSDGDFGQDLRSKKRRQGSDTRFGNWSARFSSRLPSLSRWRSASTSSKAASFAYSASSDPSLASRRPSLVRAISRSSSLSGPARTASDYPAQDSDIPETPALSFYESCESVVLPSPLEVSPATVGKKLERDRTIATTPLLPPLMTEAPVPASSQTRPPSLQMSPLQSPTLPSPVPDLSGTKTFPSPPLSNKPSLTSLWRGTVSSTFSDAPSPVPYLFDLQDAWSDRLGHANFTIEPKPYMPETADLATLQAFRADWNQARTNYAKHLVRISEHYGSTSNIYALTEAKWAEIDQEWQRNEDQLVERLGKNDPVALSQLRRTSEERLSPSVPRMLSDDGKFPELGDVEIVGPMQRDAVMAGNSQHERKNSVSALLKSLAGKVGLRK